MTVGTGPFEFSSWSFNNQLVLTRNEDYWKGASGLPGVVIKIIPDTETQSMMFESGELDILEPGLCCRFGRPFHRDLSGP